MSALSDHLDWAIWTSSIPHHGSWWVCREEEGAECLVPGMAELHPHIPSLLPSHRPYRDLSSASPTGLELHAGSFAITLAISFQRGWGRGGGQGRDCQVYYLGVCWLGCIYIFLFFFYCRWQSTCESLSCVHYWGFYSLMNVTHLRNRIVFHCSRCSVEHLWLMSSYLNISCKHQKLFVCFNVPSHPITQWRWKIEMQRCLAKRFFFPPPSSLCFPWCICAWCLISMQWDAEIPLLNISFLSACLHLCKEARATWRSGGCQFQMLNNFTIIASCEDPIYCCIRDTVPWDSTPCLPVIHIREK